MPSPDPVADDVEIVRAACAQAKRFALKAIELAAVSGVSEPTARAVLRGVVPTHSRCLHGLATFTSRAKVARSRADLGLADHRGSHASR